VRWYSLDCRSLELLANQTICALRRVMFVEAPALTLSCPYDYASVLRWFAERSAGRSALSLHFNSHLDRIFSPFVFATGVT
jgi:hypothetical protein